MNHIMLDIESLDVTPTAVVLSIGAVRMRNGSITDRMYVKLDAQDQIDEGRTISLPTLRWWTTQDPKLFAEALSGERTVIEALDDLFNFIPADACVWGNGVGMDNVVIQDLCRHYNFEIPWSFRGDRCYRTMRGTPLFKMWNSENEVVFTGQPHNPLDDAAYQATVLLEYDAWLRKTTGVGVME